MDAVSAWSPFARRAAFSGRRNIVHAGMGRWAGSLCVANSRDRIPPNRHPHRARKVGSGWPAILPNHHVPTASRPARGPRSGSMQSRPSPRRTGLGPISRNNRATRVGQSLHRSSVLDRFTNVPAPIGGVRYLCGRSHLTGQIGNQPQSRRAEGDLGCRLLERFQRWVHQR